MVRGVLSAEASYEKNKVLQRGVICAGASCNILATAVLMSD